MGAITGIGNADFFSACHLFYHITQDLTHP